MPLTSCLRLKHELQWPWEGELTSWREEMKAQLSAPCSPNPGPPGIHRVIMERLFCAQHCASVVQLLSHVLLFATPWTAACQAPLSFTVSWSLLNYLILCHSLLLLPSIFPSIRIFSNELALPIRWPKYWSFSFSISPSNEYSWLISFRIDSLDLLAVQGTLKSPLQHHSSKPSILWRSAFFIVQLSHPHMTTGKT